MILLLEIADVVGKMENQTNISYVIVFISFTPHFYVPEKQGLRP